MTSIFLGTNNKDKIKEFTRILEPLELEIESLRTIRVFNFDPPENGETFEAIAIKKAIAWADRVNLPTLVDDSGLCVYALGGLPGIKSKRFVPGTDKDRNLHLLKLLEKYKDKEDRSAYYHCALVFYDPDTKQKFATEGKCYGTISFEKQGKNGFGYDSVFIPDGFSLTLGELPSTIKDNISHRKRAIENIYPFLQKWSQANKKHE